MIRVGPNGLVLPPEAMSKIVLPILRTIRGASHASIQYRSDRDEWSTGKCVVPHRQPILLVRGAEIDGGCRRAIGHQLLPVACCSSLRTDCSSRRLEGAEFRKGYSVRGQSFR